MKKTFTILCSLVLLCGSCHKQAKYFPTNLEPTPIEIVRFDQALMNVSQAHVREDVRLLWNEYPDFMPVFTEDILGIAAADTDYLCQALPMFLEDTLYGFRETNQLAKELFANTRDIGKQLDRAFSRIHYLYPEWEMPQLYFYISGFNASIQFVEEDIAVGIDMYLGSDYPLYNRVVYDYQRITMRPECIATDVVSAYLFRHIPYTSDKSRLLENMLYRGKVMYLLSLVMAPEKEWDTFGYTEQQWRWCKKYERAIWHTMMDQKDLFKSENMVLTSYLNDGPFTSVISQEAPARLGTWIGYQIAESYMRHNKDITLQQLMQEGDAQKILENSFYKP